MKLSEYIAKLQAILETEGDLDVVKINPYGDAMSGARSYSYESAPRVAGTFKMSDRQFVRLANIGTPLSVTETGKAVLVGAEPVITFTVGSTSVFNVMGGHKQRAEELNKPVCIGAGGGGGQAGFGDWMFPDGHTERLPAGDEPRWPQEAPHNAG